jgi:tRNA U54 and U55 pseudouridine synthase Pus10
VDGRMRVFLGPGATIETRLEALEKNVTVMIDESITKRIEELFRKNADAVRHEEQSRREDDAAILARLDAEATIDRHIALIGASWKMAREAPQARQPAQHVKKQANDNSRENPDHGPFISFIVCPGNISSYLVQRSGKEKSAAILAACRSNLLEQNFL